jgi:hypothetical protein
VDGLNVGLGAAAGDVAVGVVEPRNLAKSVDCVALQIGDGLVGRWVAGIRREKVDSGLVGARMWLGAHRREHPVELLRAVLPHVLHYQSIAATEV